jgi:hypothetical protein
MSGRCCLGQDDGNGILRAANSGVAVAAQPGSLVRVPNGGGAKIRPTLTSALGGTPASGSRAGSSKRWRPPRRRRGRACGTRVEPRRAPGSGAEPGAYRHRGNPQPMARANVRNVHGGAEEQQRQADQEEQARHDSTSLCSPSNRPPPHKMVPLGHAVQSHSSRICGAYGHEQRPVDLGDSLEVRRNAVAASCAVTGGNAAVRGAGLCAVQDRRGTHSGHSRVGRGPMPLPSSASGVNPVRRGRMPSR